LPGNQPDGATEASRATSDHSIRTGASGTHSVSHADHGRSPRQVSRCKGPWPASKTYRHDVCYVNRGHTNLERWLKNCLCEKLFKVTIVMAEQPELPI
jgi:hypothetical protein